MSERIYVIAGKESSRVNARCRELVDQLLDPEARITGLLSVDGSQAALAEILDELRTMPFLTTQRVVVIKDAEDFVSKNRPALEKYFDHPSETGILILTVGSWLKSTKLAKKLPKAGQLINLVPPKRNELGRYLIDHARQANQKTLDRNAAALLIDLVGENLMQLYNEVDKLALFARDDKAITVQHVEALAGHNRIFGAFEVIEAMMAGRTMQAIARLRNMFAEDKSAEYTVVGAFAYHLRRLFRAKALLDKGEAPYAVGQKLRIWRDKDRFFAQLRQSSLPQIAATLEQLAAIDHAVKTGRAKTQVAMEQLVLKLAR